MPLPESLKTFWETCYTDGNTGWDRGESHPALRQWIDAKELSPCRMVVPGCGRGYEVLHLCQLGFEVTAIDYAQAPIDYLRSKLEADGQTAELIQGDLFDVEFSNQLDAVYEQTCLCAIAPELRTKYAEKVSQWLKPGGKLFLLMMQASEAKGPPFHCEVADMRELFPEPVWEWPESPPVAYEHPRGKLLELATVLTRGTPSTSG